MFKASAVVCGLVIFFAVVFTSVVVITGCGSNQANEPKPPAALEKFASGIEASMARDKEREGEQATLRTQLAADISPVVDLGKAKFKEAIAESFGNDAADHGTITADKEAVKKFGENKWEVNGRYKGADKEGNPIERTWTATIEIEDGFDGLQCSGVKLNDQ